MEQKKYFGAALVEFALILPILLVVGIGVIEFSILFFDKTMITNASREGARYGVVLRSPDYATMDEVVTYAGSFTTGLISFSSSSASISASSSVSPPAFGDTLTVSVSYVYTSLLAFKLLGFSSNSMTLNASTTMIYE